MSNFLKDISFEYGSTSLPGGGGFSCEKASGVEELTCFSNGAIMISEDIYSWNVALSQEEKQALAAALWAIIDQEPIATETAIILDGSPTHLSLEYKANKIEHSWNSFSDHEFINQFSKLISQLSNKPHTKRMLKTPPPVIE